MQRRARVAVALIAALALHGLVRELVVDAGPRVRPVAPEPPRRAVEIALWTATPPPEPRAPQAASAPSRAAPPLTPPPRAAAPAPAADEAGAPEAPAAPVVESAPAAAPTLPARPRSLLERVLAGASAGPTPGLDVLDPSRRVAPASDAERARGKILALVGAASARGAPPPADAGTVIDDLEPLEGGGYRYDTGGFVATIHVDGTVSFEDKDHREGLFSSGLPGRDPKRPLEPYGPALEPWARPDGSPAPRVMGAPLADNAATLGSGSFDPTAALLRAQGQDPYDAEKLCFLETTEPLRADLREAFERAQLAGLRLQLERLWFDEARPAVERRAALFSTWDECREEAVGKLARALIESFIRQHLPAGSVDAYGAQELAALNARRSSAAPFAPYG